MKKVIMTEHAPVAIGPYSQAVEVNGVLYVSGQIPLIPETMVLVSESVRDQTKQALLNLNAIFKAANYKVNDVVKCNVYLQNMDDFEIVNEEYAIFFGEHKPARCAIEVSRLPKDVKVEIDVICVR